MQVQNNKLAFEPGESALSFHAALVLFVDYAPEQLDQPVAMAVCSQLKQTAKLWLQSLKLSVLIESTNPSLN